jgi:hypothetical protein
VIRWQFCRLLSLCVVAAGCGAGSSGRLETDPAVVELRSESNQPRMQQRVLKVRNTGNTPVKITRVDASCGCAAAGVPSRTLLPPGESAEIALSLSPPEYGESEQSVTIHSDSRGTPVVRVPVRLHGSEQKIPHLRSYERELRMVTARGSRAGRTLFSIRAVEMDGAPLFVTGVRANGPGCTAVVEPRPDVLNLAKGVINREYLVTVEATPAATGESAGTWWLTIDTTAGPQESAIRVTCDVPRLLRCVPDRLTIPADSAGEVRRFTAFVDASLGTDVKVVAPEKSGLDVAEESRVDGGTFVAVRFRVSPRPGAATLSGRQTLRVVAGESASEMSEVGVELVREK